MAVVVVPTEVPAVAIGIISGNRTAPGNSSRDRKHRSSGKQILSHLVPQKKNGLHARVYNRRQMTGVCRFEVKPINRVCSRSSFAEHLGSGAPKYPQVNNRSGWKAFWRSAGMFYVSPLRRIFAECQTPSFGFAGGKVIAVRDNQVWVFTTIAATEQHRHARPWRCHRRAWRIVIGLGGAEFRLPLLRFNRMTTQASLIRQSALRACPCPQVLFTCQLNILFNSPPG
jgi:hypothetical protein